jgi:hypothetical protein
MSLANLLDQTATIQRNVPVIDSIGGVNPGWSNLFTNVPCALWPASAKTVERFGTLNAATAWEICFSFNPGCTTQDLIVINNKNYSVVGTMPFGNSQISSETPCVVVCEKLNQS